MQGHDIDDTHTGQEQPDTDLAAPEAPEAPAVCKRPTAHILKRPSAHILKRPSAQILKRPSAHILPVASEDEAEPAPKSHRQYKSFAGSLRPSCEWTNAAWEVAKEAWHSWRSTCNPGLKGGPEVLASQRKFWAQIRDHLKSPSVSCKVGKDPEQWAAAARAHCDTVLAANSL